jgi:hypothetical protein
MYILIYINKYIYTYIHIYIQGDPNDEDDYQDRKLSSTMKEKMMREVQESGGDPNFSKVCICMLTYAYTYVY